MHAQIHRSAICFESNVAKAYCEKYACKDQFSSQTQGRALLYKCQSCLSPHLHSFLSPQMFAQLIACLLLNMNSNVKAYSPGRNWQASLNRCCVEGPDTPFNLTWRENQFVLGVLKVQVEKKVKSHKT